MLTPIGISVKLALGVVVVAIKTLASLKACLAKKVQALLCYLATIVSMLARVAVVS